MENSPLLGEGKNNLPEKRNYQILIIKLGKRKLLITWK